MSHTPTLLEAAADGTAISSAQIIEEFPWAAALSQSDLNAFATEILGLMRGWRATAQAYAEGLVGQPIEWLDDGGES
ncbi:hypothetical protein ACX3O0_07075 [Homoserinimonas sp. A447]